MKWIYFISVVFLVSCSNTNQVSMPQNATSSEPSPSLLTPTLTIQQRIEYETQYEALRQSQQAIESVWRDLQANQSVSCMREIPQTVLPEHILATNDIGQDLLKAATEINDSIVLWRAECQNPRPNPPSIVIDDGLRLALSAEQTLIKIEQNLRQ